MLSRIILSLTLASLLPCAAYAQDLKEQLLNAARKGDAQAVKAALAKGADVNAKTEYGATALSFATDRGHIEVIKVLLDNGADVNVKDTFYQATPLIWAAQKGHVEVLKLLLDKGATGIEVALMIGVGMGKPEVVQTVLDRGGLKPETLNMALTNANNSKRTEIAEMLKKAGASTPPPPSYKIDPEVLKSYAGVYKNQEIGDLTWTVKEGKLVGGMAGQPDLSLAAIDKTTFTAVEVAGINITFNIENEKVTSLTLKQGGGTFVFKKAEEK